MNKKNHPSLLGLPEIQPLLAKANYIDVKTVTGDVDLRTFLAGLLNYRPLWVRSLYGVRAVFVRFLGMRQQGFRFGPILTPETIPMQVGELATFFRVSLVEEEHYWFANHRDTHLTATLGVIEESIEQQKRRFSVVTVVQYHNWAGPIYLQVIRPFHHLVVLGMARAGVKYRVK